MGFHCDPWKSQATAFRRGALTHVAQSQNSSGKLSISPFQKMQESTFLSCWSLSLAWALLLSLSKSHHLPIGARLQPIFLSPSS